MRMMIIDDEPLVRQGLQKLIPWEVHGVSICAEASNGEEGLSILLAQKPDLVILDIRMPGLDGVEVAQQARGAGYDGKFIVLSGYADFSYAQHAIAFGASEFLLKPVSKNALLNAVQRAAHTLEDERVMRAYAGGDLSDTKRKLLRNILEDGIPCNKNNAELLGIDTNANGYEVALVVGNQETYASMDQYIHQIVGSGVHTAAIGNCIAAFIQGRSAIHSFRQLIEKLHSLDETAIFLVSNIEDTFDDTIPASLYTRVSILLEQLFCIRKQSVYVYHEIDKFVIYKSEPPVEAVWSDRICASICSGNGGSLSSILDALVADLAASELGQEAIIRYMQKVHLHVIAYLRSHRLLGIAEQPIDLPRADTLYEMRELMEAILGSVFFSIHDREPDDVAKLLCRYIETQYHQPITMKTLAKLFGYNTAYLGKLLKQRTGCTFSAYLDKVRCAHAKELLMRGASVSHTAEACGYSTSEHFASNFKKHIGVTPSVYRSQTGSGT